MAGVPSRPPGYGCALCIGLLRDPITGQVRAILREPETAAMGAIGEQRLEVLFSRGIPEVGDQRR